MARDLHLDLGSGHTAYHHASIIYVLNFEIEDFLWTDGRTYERTYERTDVWTLETYFIRLTRRSRTNNECKINSPQMHYSNRHKFTHHSYDVIAWPVRVKPPAGPPWGVTDDDDRHQRPLLVWPPTLCTGGPVITVNTKMKCTHVQSASAADVSASDRLVNAANRSASYANHNTPTKDE